MKNQILSEWILTFMLFFQYMVISMLLHVYLSNKSKKIKVMSSILGMISIIPIFIQSNKDIVTIDSTITIIMYNIIAILILYYLVKFIYTFSYYSSDETETKTQHNFTSFTTFLTIVSTITLTVMNTYSVISHEQLLSLFELSKGISLFVPLVVFSVTITLLLRGFNDNSIFQVKE